MVKYTAAADDGVNPSPAWQLARCQLSHVNIVNMDTADSYQLSITRTLQTPDSCWTMRRLSRMGTVTVCPDSSG